VVEFPLKFYWSSGDISHRNGRGVTTLKIFVRVVAEVPRWLKNENSFETRTSINVGLVLVTLHGGGQHFT